MRNPFLAVNVSVLLVVLFFAVHALALDKTLYRFPGGHRGSDPEYGIVLDATGNVYGTTSYGGSYGWGTVYELKKSKNRWHQQVIYSFLGGVDGYQPWSNLLIDQNGNLYGTTPFGGTGTGCENQSGGCGTFFVLTPSHGNWKHTVLYNFCSVSDCSDGANPYGLSFDRSGDILGMAGGGICSYCGVVFKLHRSSRGWTETVVHTFDDQGDGFDPNPGLTVDGAGNVYGTTWSGGSSGYGIVFELQAMKHAWTELILYQFTGSGDDKDPNGGLVVDAKGNLYGSTSDNFGGCTYGCGTIYELTPSKGGWVKNIVYAFDGPHGASPMRCFSIRQVTITAQPCLEANTTAAQSSSWSQERSGRSKFFITSLDKAAMPTRILD